MNRWTPRAGHGNKVNHGNKEVRQALGIAPPPEVYVSPYADEFLQKAKEKRERKAARNMALYLSSKASTARLQAIKALASRRGLDA